MPRKIQGEDGKEIEVFEASELEAAKAEAQKKAAEAEAKVKELEQELNPNWREARQKMKDLEEDASKWRKEAERLGAKPESKNISQEEIDRLAEGKAREVFLSEHKEEVLARFGDKRDIVENRFNKLAQGETLSKAKINELVQEAARAVGINRMPDPEINAIAAGGGAAPQFQQGTSQDFADTPQGEATAAAMGLVIAPPKQS
jgi:hypothetical protein